MSGLRFNSVWLANAGVRGIKAPTTFGATEGLRGAHYDAIVVGGGVFGCTTALNLKTLGHRVALVEARTVGSGASGHSSAKLSAQQGLLYSKLCKDHNDEVARKYYDLNNCGILSLEKLVRQHYINCDFERRGHTTFTSDTTKPQLILDEFDACQKLGIPSVLLGENELANELPLSIGAKIGICFPDQAQFNPYLYCREVSKLVDGDGSRVYENSRVTSIDQQNPHRVNIVDHNSVLTANHVVVATHLPIMDRSMHFAMLKPSRSHCIAARVRNKPIHNMFLSADQPTRSLRATSEDNIIVVTGDAIEQGDEPMTQKFYDDLTEWAMQHFDVEEVICKWSSMDYCSGDHLPFIGPLFRGTDTIFTATGFNKWGLAAGVTAAEIVTDLIKGQHHPLLDIVDARRWDLRHQWRTMAEEGFHAASHFVKDKINTLLPHINIRMLNPGEGGIVEAGMDTVGAYRDQSGRFFVVKPTCTHLGCTLVFNDGDKVWDCPCHGSRFTPEGDVIDGPAKRPLTRYYDLEW